MPALPRNYVPRPRFWEKLESATEGSVTLVVAPVGAGKTLGVAGWLQHTGRASCATWVAASADLTIEDLNRLMTSSEHDRSPRLLVIDDAQLLPHALFADLDDRLNQDPGSLRLVLIGRWDLPLPRLVPEMLGHLTVLRGDLLRLDKNEVAALVADQARTDNAEVAEAIYSRAGGWCAAVVLAARAVATSPDPVAAARRLLGGTSVVDQVAKEAFAALTPRERHVLLCVAPEMVVSASVAARLSHDVDAGRVLADLEASGLLVSRHIGAGQVDERREECAGFDAVDLEQAGPSYRLHPLLVEMARRRLTAGGVDVERARASIRRAVGADIGQGIRRDALRRFVSVGALDAAATLLREDGLRLVLCGEANEIESFARQHPAQIRDDLGCMLPVVLHRWMAGDLEAAQYWLQRMNTVANADEREGSLSTAWRFEHLLARLMHARLADKVSDNLVLGAQASVASVGPVAASASPLIALVRLELGYAHLHEGRFAEADQQLGAVVAYARLNDLPALSAKASSKLALSQFLQGREHVAEQLVEKTAAVDQGIAHAPTVHSGARLALELARAQVDVQAAPEAQTSGPVAQPIRQHPADLIARVLASMLTSRRLLLRGLVAEAQRCLDAEPIRTNVPPTLRVPLLLEQALQANLAADRDALAHVEQQLSQLGAPGEAALVAAFRADQLGDATTAAELCHTAAETSTYAQPPVAALALVLRAQLVNKEGRQQEALANLREALTTTAVRRSTLPFLGWSRHGTPVKTLLRTLAQQSPSPWLDELIAAVDDKVAIVAVAAQMTATPRERARVPDDVMRPRISARERDVLHALARGATYSDIAAQLYVSENTVKTHVSNLYGKLAAKGRSEALAVARTMQLL